MRELNTKNLFIFSLGFWQQTLLLWQRNFYWLFQINSFCKIYLDVLVAIPRLNLKSCALTVFYVIFPFVSAIDLSSSCKKWLSYLSHAISPYLHGKLINWTSAFYLSFYCTILPTILNILIFMNRVVSIICICRLYFLFFHK